MTTPRFHVEGRKVCAVCAHVLDWDDEGNYFILAEDLKTKPDHIHVPVEDTEVFVDEHCDFCYGTEDVSWVLPVDNFSVGTVPLGKTGFLMMGHHNYIGDWSACGGCAPLIQHNQWNALLTRVRQSYLEHEREWLPEIEPTIRALWRNLRKNIKGSLYRVPMP